MTCISLKKTASASPSPCNKVTVPNKGEQGIPPKTKLKLVNPTTGETEAGVPRMIIWIPVSNMDENLGINKTEMALLGKVFPLLNHSLKWFPPKKTKLVLFWEDAIPNG